jgi:hypothetical protein
MPQWTKALYLAYLKSAHWKAVQKAIYRTKPWCFLCRTRRRLHLHHLSYENVYHESLIIDGWHDLVVLCKTHHLGFHAWAKRYRVEPNVGMLQLFQREMQLYDQRSIVRTVGRD